MTRAEIIKLLRTLPVEGGKVTEMQGEYIARLFAGDHGLFAELDSSDGSPAADLEGWHWKLRQARNGTPRFFDILDSPEVSHLDVELAKYDEVPDSDLRIDVPRGERINVALRLTNGEEVLISLVDLGNHLSVDVDMFDRDGEHEIEAFTMRKGGKSEHISGNTLVAMLRREADRGAA